LLNLGPQSYVQSLTHARTHAHSLYYAYPFQVPVSKFMFYKCLSIFNYVIS